MCAEWHCDPQVEENEGSFPDLVTNTIWGVVVRIVHVLRIVTSDPLLQSCIRKHRQRATNVCCCCISKIEVQRSGRRARLPPVTVGHELAPFAKAARWRRMTAARRQRVATVTPAQ